MIRTLSLSTFGKFFRRELRFSPFTVVTGPNEAGKTTVFDALFDALCAESRNEKRVSWRRLAERYGALRKAVLTWEEGFVPLSFDYAEFLEIFAIRAGDTSVNSAGSGSWRTAAEARLLTAGLNPEQLAAELADKAENFRKDSPQARIKKLKELVKESSAVAAELKTRRDLILGGEAELAKLEAAKQAKALELEGKAGEAHALKTSIEELAGACRLAAANAGIKLLREHKEAADALAAMAMYAKNELPAYQAIRLEQLEKEKTAASSEAVLKGRQAALAAAKAAVEQLDAREQDLKNQKDLAEALFGKLNAFTSEPELLELIVDQKMRRGIWAAGAALALFVAFSGGNIFAYIAAAAIAGAGAWVGLKLSVKERFVGHSPEANRQFLAGLAAEASGVFTETFQPQNLDEARAFFAKVSADYAAAGETLAAKSMEAGDLDAAAAMDGRNLEDAKAASEKAAAAAAAWLKARGCGTEEEYREKLAAYDKQAARAANLGEALKIARDRNNVSDDEELREKLFADREDLGERRKLDPKKANEAELEKLKSRVPLLSEEVHAIEAALGELDKSLGIARAASGARLEGLPESINRAETDIAAAGEEIAALELQIKGYTLAAGIFRQLSASSALAFDALGREVSCTLAGLMPAPVVEFQAFDALTAKVGDATGGLRQVEHLSSGTRDLFMLAARLTMAKKARTGPGGLAHALLVLDEPFYTLDAARTRAALKLLADFHAQTKWQIIILTKDPAVAAIAKGIEGLGAAELDLAEEPK
ncbi:MAG: AAA family ATPase [Elusimicrobia bacterium]|nr:AAA family ATPase [Elusimicrobiota bacterium]